MQPRGGVASGSWCLCRRRDQVIETALDDITSDQTRNELMDIFELQPMGGSGGSEKGFRNAL